MALQQKIKDRNLVEKFLFCAVPAVLSLTFLFVCQWFQVGRYNKAPEPCPFVHLAEIGECVQTPVKIKTVDLDSRRIQGCMPSIESPAAKNADSSQGRFSFGVGFHASCQDSIVQTTMLPSNSNSLIQNIDSFFQLPLETQSLVDGKVDLENISQNYCDMLKNRVNALLYNQSHLRVASFTLREYPDLEVGLATDSGIQMTSVDRRVFTIKRAEFRSLFNSHLITEQESQQEAQNHLNVIASILRVKKLLSDQVVLMESALHQLQEMRPVVTQQACQRTIPGVEVMPLSVQFYSSVPCGGDFCLPVAGSYHYQTSEVTLGLGKSKFIPIMANSKFGVLTGLEVSSRVQIGHHISISSPGLRGFMGFGFRV